MSNSNFQSEIIGILSRKPEYFATTIITKDFFEKPFDYYFEKLRNMYIEDGEINDVEMFNDPAVDDALYFNIKTNVLHSYEKYFKSIEKKLVDEYKKKKIEEYTNKLMKGDIDTNKFTDSVNKLKELSTTESHVYTSKSIQKLLTRKPINIDFEKYKTLQKLSRIKEKDMVILAGKTGTGKTGLGLNLLNDLSKKYNCLYINIELSEEVIVQRLAAMNTGITMDELDKVYELPQYKINQLEEYAKQVDDNPNIEFLTGSQTITNITNVVGGLDQSKHYIVFIDHIGRISGYGKSLYERATNNAIQLRNLSLDFNCTIIALCQLSRESARVDRPSLELLRDSGEIEQSARKVLFVWEEKDGQYNIYICKNDSGSLGRFPVVYKKDIQRFDEIDMNTFSKDVRR